MQLLLSVCLSLAHDCKHMQTPDDVVFVMDSSIGQAAKDQATAFKEAVSVGVCVYVCVGVCVSFPVSERCVCRLRHHHQA